MSCSGFVERDFGGCAGFDEDGSGGVGSDAIVAGGGVGIGYEGGGIWLRLGRCHG